MTTQLFSTLPETQEHAIALLRAFAAADLAWHLDDDPRTIIYCIGAERIFTDEQANFCGALVGRLNALWPNEGTCVNAGAWKAAELAGWLDNDETE